MEFVIYHLSRIFSYNEKSCIVDNALSQFCATQRRKGATCADDSKKKNKEFGIYLGYKCGTHVPHT